MLHRRHFTLFSIRERGEWPARVKEEKNHESNFDKFLIL